MRSSLVMSLIGMTSMALALLVGCGDDDNKPVTSKVGQSCTRTADCDPGLSCIGNVCYKFAPAAGGSGGGANLVPPPLGTEGQTCSSRLDCVSGLDCFNNRCTAPVSGDAGATGSGGPQLGTRGESCRVNSDCDKDLVCVVTTVAGTGVCDLANFGVKATGLTCSGECLEAADCCQLPMALHTTSIRSCQDVAAAIKTGSVDCDAPADAAASKLCFEQATYCDCGKKTWTCDEDTHACVYGETCDPTAGLDAPKGCPSHSRLYDTSARTCNPDTKTCVGASVSKSCTNDKSCEGKQVVDSTPDDLCTSGECTCYSGNKQCYRKCARDIDCGAGRVCDDAKVCKPDDTCVTDSQCAIANHNVAFKCNAGTCAQSCATDRDCSPSGVSGAFAGKVCGADGFCASVAQDCNEDSQCAPLSVGGLKPFCVTPPPGPGDSVASAITN